MLADIAVRDPEAFRRFAEQAREAVGCLTRSRITTSPGAQARRPFLS